MELERFRVEAIRIFDFLIERCGRPFVCLLGDSPLGHVARRRLVRRELREAKRLALAAKALPTRIATEDKEEYQRHKVERMRLAARAWAVYDRYLGFRSKSEALKPYVGLPPRFLRDALEALDLRVDASWYFEGYTMPAAVQPHALLERSLAMREQLLGTDHPAIADVLEQIDFRRNPADMQRAVTIREKAFGRDSPTLVTPLSRLIWHFESRKDGAAANPYRDHIVRILKIHPNALSGDYHHDEVVVEWCIALGRLDDAEYFLEQLVGRGHLDASGAFENGVLIALAHGKAGNPSDAFRVLGRCMERALENPVGIIAEGIVSAEVNGLKVLALLGALLRLQTDNFEHERILQALAGRLDPARWALDGRPLNAANVRNLEARSELARRYEELSAVEQSDVFAFLDAYAHHLSATRGADAERLVAELAEELRYSLEHFRPEPG